MARVSAGQTSAKAITIERINESMHQPSLLFSLPGGSSVMVASNDATVFAHCTVLVRGTVLFGGTVFDRVTLLAGLAWLRGKA